MEALGTLEAGELLGVCQMCQGAFALRRREPGPFGKQQHPVALRDGRSELAQQRNLLLTLTGAAADEGVAGALPDDVQTRIPEQLALHDVPQTEGVRLRTNTAGKSVSSVLVCRLNKNSGPRRTASSPVTSARMLNRRVAPAKSVRAHTRCRSRFHVTIRSAVAPGHSALATHSSKLASDTNSLAHEVERERERATQGDEMARAADGVRR